MASAAARLVDRYLDHLRIERRMSSHTAAGYRRDLRRLTRFCAAEALDHWNDVDPHVARRFAGDLRRRGLSARSIQRALSAARGFYRYLLKHSTVTTNPFVGIPAPKPDQRLPKALSVDQVSLLVAVEGKAPLAVRDRALMELFYSSGLRLSELVELDLPRIDLRSASVRVKGKGNKERVIPVGRYAVEAIRAWLPVRSGMAAGGEGSVRGPSSSGFGTGPGCRAWTVPCTRTC